MKKTLKDKKIFNLIPLLLIIVVFSMTLGYSALQQTLYVYGEAMIDAPEYKIEIRAITAKKAINEAYQNSSPSFENTEGAMYTVLPKATSSLIYEITIRNVGLSNGILDYIFVSQDNANMKYKIGGISAGDILLAGETRVVTVEIEYLDNVTDVSSNTVATLINFEFLQQTDNYSNECTLAWDGSSTSEPLIRNVYGTDYYQISNANELAWFSNTVNGGTNNINAMLTDNICLNSKAFTQIGTTSYNGIFDGQNRTIKDYSFSQDTSIKDNYTSYIGLFRNNQGSIKNTNLTINIADTVSYQCPTLGGNHAVTEYVGGLVTNNQGIISNSSVSGDINNKYTITTNCAVARPNGYYYIGAIAGQNSGIITGSYNKTKITANNSLESLRCNYSKYEHIYLGGIAGQNTGFISDTYNREALESHVYIDHKNTEYFGYVGGLVGESTGGTIKNSYSAATITHTNEVTASDSDTIIDTISGCAVASNTSTITNVYYDNICSHAGVGTAASSTDMKNPSLAVEEFLGSYFKTDINNINGYYPILKWQTK